MANQSSDLPSLKALASSDPRLRRLAFKQIYAHIAERPTRLTTTQCLQLWRGFFVALYMHDSKSMVSVQNLISSLADQFAVIAGKESEGEPSQLGIFSEAFWETMSREWSGIDVHRMNKILLLIRMATRAIFRICMPSVDVEPYKPASSGDVDEQVAIFEKWPLSLRERKVPDGLRYHMLDIWVDELEEAGGQANGEFHQEIAGVRDKFLEPVEKLGKDGLTKPVRTRAKETLAQAKKLFHDGSHDEIED